jgi:hypothetical protein
VNGYNLNNLRLEASIYFRNKEKECLRDMYRGINEFKRLSRSNVLKDDNGDVLADSDNLFK